MLGQPAPCWGSWAKGWHTALAAFDTVVPLFGSLCF